MGKVLAEGDPAPTFTLPASDGTDVTLPAGHVVLYSYPKDDTPGCTLEAKEFTSLHEQFRKKGVAVFGISKDDTASHCAFTEKYGLKVPLLADETGETLEAYGCLEGESINRSTFVIRDGVIEKIYRSVTPEGHAQELLRLF